MGNTWVQMFGVNQNRRDQEFALLAKQWGWTYKGEVKRSELTFTKGFFYIINEVRNLITSNVNGVEVSLFDCIYSVGSHVRERGTAVHFRSSQLRLPDFRLEPRRLLSPAAINISTNPKFSNAYVLSGQNEQAIRLAFQPGILSHYERVNPVYSIGLGNELFYYRPTYMEEVENVRYLLDEAFYALNLFQQSNYLMGMTDPKAICVEANLYINARQVELAMDACQRSLQLDPHFPDAHNCLGRAYEALGQYEAALEAFKQELHYSGGNSAPVHFNIGLMLYNLKRYAEAVIELEQANNLRPNHPPTIKMLCLSYAYANNIQGCWQLYGILQSIDKAKAESVAKELHWIQ